jgi:hypothetical protein
MKNKEKNPKAILWGSIISTALILLFFFLQTFENEGLNLNQQWILLSLVPLLVALFIGNYITSLKYGDIEISAIDKEPIGFDSDIIDIIKAIRAKEKEGLDNLRALTNKKEIEVLLFKYGRVGYYSKNVISSYLKELPNIKYFEIVDENDEFLCLISLRTVIKVTRRHPNSDDNQLIIQNLESFISSLENRTILTDYQHALEEFIMDDDTLINSYIKLRKSPENLLPILNRRKRLIGIIKTNSVERKIAQLYLNHYQSGSKER